MRGLVVVLGIDFHVVGRLDRNQLLAVLRSHGLGDGGGHPLAQHFQYDAHAGGVDWTAQSCTGDGKCLFEIDAVLHGRGLGEGNSGAGNCTLVFLVAVRFREHPR
ncbi:hypothetical protein D3C87_1896670 [compost metagenome]